VVIFSFFLFFHPALDVKSDMETQRIAPTTPHLVEWCISFDTPIKIGAEDAPRPSPLQSKLGAVANPA
jgi:hypothetical protein